MSPIEIPILKWSNLARFLIAMALRSFNSLSCPFTQLTPIQKYVHKNILCIRLYIVCTNVSYLKSILKCSNLARLLIAMALRIFRICHAFLPSSHAIHKHVHVLFYLMQINFIYNTNVSIEFPILKWSNLARLLIAMALRNFRICHASLPSSHAIH